MPSSMGRCCSPWSIGSSLQGRARQKARPDFDCMILLEQANRAFGPVIRVLVGGTERPTPGRVWIRRSRRGYLNEPSPFDPEDTSTRAISSRSNGSQLLGRKSDLINVGGNKVHPCSGSDCSPYHCTDSSIRANCATGSPATEDRLIRRHRDSATSFQSDVTE